MATLTNEQLADLRQALRKNYEFDEIDFDKPIINAAFQGMEDWYQANKAEAITYVDTATSPYTFSNTEKKALGGAYFGFRFSQDGGG